MIKIRQQIEMHTLKIKKSEINKMKKNKRKNKKIKKNKNTNKITMMRSKEIDNITETVKSMDKDNEDNNDDKDDDNNSDDNSDDDDDDVKLKPLRLEDDMPNANSKSRQHSNTFIFKTADHEPH